MLLITDWGITTPVCFSFLCLLDSDSQKCVWHTLFCSQRHDTTSELLGFLFCVSHFLFYLRYSGCGRFAIWARVFVICHVWSESLIYSCPGPPPHRLCLLCFFGVFSLVRPEWNPGETLCDLFILMDFLVASTCLNRRLLSLCVLINRVFHPSALPSVQMCRVIVPSGFVCLCPRCGSTSRTLLWL